MTHSTNKPIVILTLLEIVCLVLLISLIKLVSKALDQYNATRDTILKSHAAFLGLYLFSKFIKTINLKQLIFTVKKLHFHDENHIFIYV